MRTYSQFINEETILLPEGVTTEATYAEMAICYAYNLKKLLGGKFNSYWEYEYEGKYDKEHFTALGNAGMTTNDFEKLDDKLLNTGKLVVETLGNVGPFLVWSGRGNSGSNNYKMGSDTTPKADFYGDDQNHISLKKAGDSGASAQLMSAKSGEATGVVKAAIGHYESSSSTKIAQTKLFKEVIDILQNKMLAAARNDLNVEVGKGKDDFEKWYIEKSTRRQMIVNLLKSLRIRFKTKDVDEHMKAELSIMGAGTRALKNAEQKLIEGIPRLQRSEMEIYFNEYTEDVSKSIFGAKVSAKHLRNVDPSKLEAPELKKQVIDIIGTAIDSKEWQSKLSQFFNKNEDLKRWIVYEAASGLYKFTGSYSKNREYRGSNKAVANKILVFTDRGVKVVHGVYKYSGENAQLVNNISISFKGSGRDKYPKLGLSASTEYYLPMLAEEIDRINKNFLTEGIFSNIKSALSNYWNQFKNAMIKFYQNVILGAIDKIKEWAEISFEFFMDQFGIEISNNKILATPNW